MVIMNNKIICNDKYSDSEKLKAVTSDNFRFFGLADEEEGEAMRIAAAVRGGGGGIGGKRTQNPDTAKYDGNGNDNGNGNISSNSSRYVSGGGSGVLVRSTTFIIGQTRQLANTYTFT